MGDLYRDRLDSSYNRLKKHKMGANKSDSGTNVTEERKFVGFDACQKVLDSGVDMVILACPPHFRPIHFEAAINAGKHVFMEKPVAVDPVGVHKVIAVSELAEQKRLAVVAGTQRRHSPSYIEVMKRIQDGAIGEVVSGQCYWNMGGLWLRKRQWCQSQ